MKEGNVVCRRAALCRRRNPHVAAVCYHSEEHAEEGCCARPCEVGAGAVCGAARKRWWRRLGEWLDVSGDTK